MTVNRLGSANCASESGACSLAMTSIVPASIAEFMAFGSAMYLKVTVS